MLSRYSFENNSTFAEYFNLVYKMTVSDLITTKEAADNLGVTMRRVTALIAEGRLPSQQIGREHLIKKTDLELVRERKTGRPKKEKK